MGKHCQVLSLDCNTSKPLKSLSHKWCDRMSCASHLWVHSERNLSIYKFSIKPTGKLCAKSLALSSYSDLFCCLGGGGGGGKHVLRRSVLLTAAITGEVQQATDFFFSLGVRGEGNVPE